MSKLTDAEFERARERSPDLIQSARQLPEYGAEKEGYWTGDRFMKQVENAANIVDIKYDKDNYTVVWLFDQSSCHRKFGEKALLAKNILVKDGQGGWGQCGKRTKKIVTGECVAKGLRSILQERGINTSKMRADDMRVV